MALQNLRKASKAEFVAEIKEGELMIPEYLQIGCMLRIADATEQMAANMTRIVDELMATKDEAARWKRKYELKVELCNEWRRKALGK